MRIHESIEEDHGNPNTELAMIGGVPEEALKGKIDGRWRVLDRMPRIVVDQKPDEPCIFSYHYEYKDFCEYYGFIDVSEITKLLF